MAKEYTCGICGEKFTRDRESRLVTAVQNHAMKEHDTEMEEAEIREDIEDT